MKKKNNKNQAENHKKLIWSVWIVQGMNVQKKKLLTHCGVMIYGVIDVG